MVTKLQHTEDILVGKLGGHADETKDYNKEKQLSEDSSQKRRK